MLKFDLGGLSAVISECATDRVVAVCKTHTSLSDDNIYELQQTPRPWLTAHWQSELAHPGALSLWAQRIEPTLSLPGLAYAIAGTPHPALWAAITGSLALVPFLGYVAVFALTLQLAMAGAATSALLSFGLGCVVLFCGDKIVRPVVARDGTRLGFVWVLMGCLGGFEVLGLVGLVIGPVVLSLARELWEQSVRDLALPDLADPTPPFDQTAR